MIWPRGFRAEGKKWCSSQGLNASFYNEFHPECISPFKDLERLADAFCILCAVLLPGSGFVIASGQFGNLAGSSVGVTGELLEIPQKL
jgi:hypothetical protein